MDNHSKRFNPLKICIISSFPPNKGGESTYAFSYVRALENYLGNKIDQIHIITFNERNDEKEESKKIGKVTIHRIFSSCDLSKHFSFFKLLRLILKLKPDFIHCEYSPTPFHNFGWLLGEPLLLLFIISKRVLGIPVLVTLHTIWLPPEVKQRSSELSKNLLVRSIITRYFVGFVKLFSKVVDKFYLLSNTDSRKMVNDFCSSYNIPPTKAGIELHGIWRSNDINNRVDLERVQRTQEANINIRCLGFINPYKGYEFAIFAMRDVKEAIPNALLTIAGDFTPNFAQHESKRYIEKLNEIIREENLNSVVKIVQKYLTEVEFQDYINTSDIILLPYSRVVAASGILHEAISKKIPVIVSGSGDLFNELTEFIPVIPAQNSELLGKEIIRICTSTEYQKKIISNYHEYIDTHDWEKIVIKVYNDVMRIKKIK
jgi:glycosyltransferase involved in cell wall biosynthesis